MDAKNLIGHLTSALGVALMALEQGQSLSARVAANGPTIGEVINRALNLKLDSENKSSDNALLGTQMKLEEKIKAFNLLPMTSAMISFVCETFPETANLGSFDYVKFHQAKPYFYSKRHIEEHTIDELLHAFVGAYLK